MYSWNDFINDFPYTNFSDINVSWFLNKFKQIFDEWEGLYNQMLSWKTATDEYNATWREQQEQAFTTWENNFETAIDAWKAQTETDIGTWETDTIASLEAWKAVFINQYNALKLEVEQIAEDAEAAKNSAQASATSAANSADSASATALALQASLEQIDTNTNDISDLKTQLNEIVDITPTSNLYDKTRAIDGYLVDQNPNAANLYGLSAYANAVLSGFVPVEEGKQYTIYDGATQWVGSIFFVSKQEEDTNFTGICCIKSSSGSYGSWSGPSGKVEATGRQTDNYTFKILVGSGITHVIWYIKKADQSGDYYGSHDGITNIVNTVQMNLGNTVLPYEDYGTVYSIPTSVVDGLDDELNTLNSTVSNLVDTSKHVTAKLNNNSFIVSSALNDTNTIAIESELYSGANGVFNFKKIRIDGSEWSNIDDDIAPIKFQNSYIGGNHGYTGMYELTFGNAHGLTTADIGAVFSDGASNQYVILSIVSTTKINVCSVYTGNIDAPITMEAPVTPVTINGNEYAVTSSDVLQLRPSVNHVTTEIFLNGKIKVTENGTYDAEFVDVVSKYNIYNIGEMLDYLTDNIGNNDNESYHSDDITDNYAEVATTYRFTERGSVTAFISVLFNADVKLGHMGGIQSYLSTSATQVSVPKSTYGVLTDKTTNTLNVTSADWSDADKPPRTFFEFMSSNMQKGMAIGYLDIGNGKDSVRKDAAFTAIQYYGATSKMYPHIIDSKTMSTGESIEAIAFKSPIVNYTLDFPAVAWFYAGKDIYLIINVQDTKNGYIPLPSYMVGKSVEVVDSDGTISVSEFVTPFGIKTDVTTYGYAMLRLTD